jgi:hypothetical protein
MDTERRIAERAASVGFAGDCGGEAALAREWLRHVEAGRFRSCTQRNIASKGAWPSTRRTLHRRYGYLRNAIHPF